MDKQIAQWKKEYGTIFRHKVKDTRVYYRQLTANEYMHVLSLNKLVDDTFIEDYIINTCLLYPSVQELRDEVGSNSIHLTKFSDTILDESMVDDKQILERMQEYRDKRDSNVIQMLIAGIIAHIPAYHPEELMEKTVDQLLEITALAESVPINAASRMTDIVHDPAQIETAKLQQQTPHMRPGYKPTGMNKGQLEQVSMVNATNALQQEMAKHGKKVKTLEQIKREKTAAAGTLAEKIRDQNERLRNMR